MSSFHYTPPAWFEHPPEQTRYRYKRNHRLVVVDAQADKRKHIERLPKTFAQEEKLSIRRLCAKLRAEEQRLADSERRDHRPFLQRFSTKAATIKSGDIIMELEDETTLHIPLAQWWTLMLGSWESYAAFLTVQHMARETT